ncbi:unnamed protein product [Prorocentrum cordatum]|uniref:DUF4116 domain-containing protein n=1 Tax=Prorocentrum cordatum TaxID=2364126 RepID=A0ABN9XCL0_9DINO|nr:unnamed protein product [Polarella glacialis]
MPLHCSGGHALQEIAAPYDGDCDLCGAQFDAASPVLHCASCHFDACGACGRQAAVAEAPAERPPGPFEVEVRGLSGVLCTLTAGPEWTGLRLKEALGVQLGLGLLEQRLLAGSEPLADEVALARQLPAPREGGPRAVTLVRRDPAIAEALERVSRGGLGAKGRQWLGSRPAVVRADREVVLAAVRHDGCALEFAAEELRADREVVLAAVQKSGFALQFASEGLRADRGFLLAAVQQNGFALACASPELRADREVALTAVDGAALEYVSEELLADPDVVAAAVLGSPAAAEHVPEGLWSRHGFVLALAARGVERAVREIHQNRDMAMLHVEVEPAALEALPDAMKLDMHFCLDAIARNVLVLGHVAASLRADRTFLLEAVRRNACAFRYVPHEVQVDAAFVAQAASGNVAVLEHAPMALWSGEFAAAVVQQEGMALRYVPDGLRADKALVLAAVRRRGRAIEHAPLEFRIEGTRSAWSPPSSRTGPPWSSSQWPSGRTTSS